MHFTFDKLQGSVFTLTWVCAWWRNHTLSQSILWSSYTVGESFQSLPRYRNPDVELFLKECIFRSGNHELMNVAVIRGGEIFTKIWSPLLGHTNRWRDLKLIPFYLSDLSNILHDLKNRQEYREGRATTYFPHLECLTLLVPEIIHIDQLPSIPLHNLFSTCPSLHTLRISHLRVSDNLDFSHLTALNIYAYYQGRFFAVLLAKCPHLKTCRMDRFIIGDDPTPATSYIPQISHNSLTTLNLTWYDKNCTIGFWRYVILPKLTCLFVSIKGHQMFEADGQPEPLGELKKMIVESKCSLMRVRLGRSLPYDAVVSFFDGLDINFGDENVIVNGVIYDPDIRQPVL
ncbi:hypothetical protein GYMLUDRAFT_44644 [Collybiopsis luxurians FD-317 M1]|uniref:F-box domain-containing protein n=1 Tax=Collybiopsis luxurians FD-317 M1 TaxID=944289 RepID=A0A0D0C9X2_9AGAR|nr:hypothetical protein GYMLUDRAFT_44644 [Collybiopsis luxurians FD-317 M1]